MSGDRGRNPGHHSRVRSALIVGGGLAGSLLAVRLAGDGWAVTVHERRPDPRTHPGEQGRSINLGLSRRGMVALDEVGLLGTVLDRTVPMRGRVVHGPDGRTMFRPYGTRADEVLHSVLRQDLTTLLVQEATRLGARFVFGSRLTELDPGTGVARFDTDPNGTDPNGTDPAPEAPDIVIGADGVHSAVRAALHRGQRADYRQDYLDWGYKELTIPAGPDGRPRTRLEALHVWPGRTGLIVAHPNRDGSLTATLFLPFHGPESFDTLRDDDAVRRFLDRRFPDARELMPDAVEEFRTNPTGSMVTVRTAPWHRGRTVLVGDACHAVYPFYGQGMNSSFEDCTVLGECLRADPTPAAFARYQARRKPHTDVLADLSASNFVELRDRVDRRWHAARTHTDRLLHRALGRSWVPLYTLVAHTSVPYADALHRARRQDAVLRGAALTGLAGVAGLAAATARSALAARSAHQARHTPPRNPTR